MQSDIIIPQQPGRLAIPKEASTTRPCRVADAYQDGRTAGFNEAFGWVMAALVLSLIIIVLVERRSAV